MHAMQTREWAAEKDVLSQTVQGLTDQHTADAARISALEQNLSEVGTVLKKMVKSQVSLKIGSLQLRRRVHLA